MINIKGGVRFGSNLLSPSEYSKLLDPSINFDQKEFTALISQKGYPVVWEKAALCPNRTGLGTTDHSMVCPFCSQTGYVYFDPVETRVLATSLKLNESFFAYGRWDQGSTMITSLPDLHFHSMDRFTFTEGFNRFNEHVYRHPRSDTDTLKYTALQIVYVVWVKDGALVTAQESLDFSVSGNEIIWRSTNRPVSRSWYTVVYVYRPRYVVTELMHQIRYSPKNAEGMAAYPTQVMAKLDYLVRNEGRDRDQGSDSEAFPEPQSPGSGNPI